MANANFDWTSSGIDNNERMKLNTDSSFATKGAVYKGTNHMGKLLAYEPQRLYNFELQIVGLDELYTADLQGTNTGGADGAIHFGSAAERILVACSSFSVPNTEFGTIEIPHYNNTTKYAGKVSFGNATLKVEQFLGSFTEQIMTTWSRCVYDPKTQNIGYKADYAKDMYVIQYDSKGGTPRVWKMENAWPAVLPGADWDYNSTDRRQMTFNIVCDRCVPDYAIDTRTFGKVLEKTTNQLNSITRAAINGNSDLPYGNAPVSGYEYNPLTNSYVDPRTGHNIKINTFSDNEAGK
jgi:hypothetical protein